jgi:hypothetical protein
MNAQPSPRGRLHLHVKTEYFNAIKSGEKTHEFRLANDYWTKRLNYTRWYSGVVIYNAYKPGSENRMEFPYVAPEIITRTHPHFGPHPVMVYAIPLNREKEAGRG